jgi:hypothetical protein
MMDAASIARVHTDLANSNLHTNQLQSAIIFSCAHLTGTQAVLKSSRLMPDTNAFPGFCRAEAGLELTLPPRFIPGQTPGGRSMKPATIALATAMAFTSTFALAHGGASSGGGNGNATGAPATGGGGTQGANTTNPATNPTAMPMGDNAKGGMKGSKMKSGKKDKE